MLIGLSMIYYQMIFLNLLFYYPFIINNLYIGYIWKSKGSILNKMGKIKNNNGNIKR